MANLTLLGTLELISNGVASPMFGGAIPGLSYKGLTRRRSPYQGQQWVLTFESWASNDPTVASPCETAYNHISSYFAAEVESIGPKHTLRVYCPDDPTGMAVGEIITTFELVGNEQQKDLREHPKALALGPDVIDEIEQVLQGKKAYDQASFKSNPDAVSLYNRLRQGNGNAYYTASQYVLKYNRIASNQAQLDVGYPNVDRIYTTAQMIAETGPPVGILSAIADAETQFTKDSANTAINGIWDGLYEIGWLKKTPTVTNQANFKYQITGEYWLEQWDTWRYKKAT